jgi:hypothetical protein
MNKNKKNIWKKFLDAFLLFLAGDSRTLLIILNFGTSKLLDPVL